MSGKSSLTVSRVLWDLWHQSAKACIRVRLFVTSCAGAQTKPTDGQTDREAGRGKAGRQTGRQADNNKTVTQRDMDREKQRSRHAGIQTHTDREADRRGDI